MLTVLIRPRCRFTLPRTNACHRMTRHLLCSERLPGSICSCLSRCPRSSLSRSVVTAGWMCRRSGTTCYLPTMRWRSMRCRGSLGQVGSWVGRCVICAGLNTNDGVHVRSYSTAVRVCVCTTKRCIRAASDHDKQMNGKRCGEWIPDASSFYATTTSSVSSMSSSIHSSTFSSAGSVFAILTISFPRAFLASANLARFLALHAFHSAISLWR
jgi:hypothetical protein